MFFFIVLGLVLSCAAQHQEMPHNRCDEPSTEFFYTQCTSCAASPSMLCPKGSRKITVGMGNVNCSYTVTINERTVLLTGCRHTCERQIMVQKCCPNFWGPLCLPCPMLSKRVCNWHGTCVDGLTGNGTCICEEGVTGFACQECKKKDVYSPQCTSACTCYHNGECNSGPNGDGQCYCQPPYTGSKCSEVSQSCTNCTAYSYCKGDASSATCECLPGFKRTGAICSGDICSTNVCDPNADCTNLGGKNYQCKCKNGYQGDGKLCIPVNPCDSDNGGCPANSTNCVYVSPGKSRCECKSGMESSSPSLGCRLKNICTSGTCHSTAQCLTSPAATPICSCAKDQIGDGSRCYGNIMERILELDRDDTLKGRLSGSIEAFEKGCQLTLTKHGPLTVFVPLLTLVSAKEVSEDIFCKHHIILDQHLRHELQSKDHWLLSGKTVRFRNTKKFIITQSPFKDFIVVQADIPAANGIIHVIDTPISKSFAASDTEKKNAQLTIGEILASNKDYNRFVSLLDNCGATMPLKGSGPLTVFVPSNEAIDQARDGSFVYMLSKGKHKLQTLLKHHIFSEAAVTIDQLAAMSEFQTMAQESITVHIASDGKISLTEKGINVQYMDIKALNGIIHVIDGVLVPPSIVPILPHRCDVAESNIIVGTCTKCSHLHETNCPPGTTELLSHQTDCEYLASPLSSVLSSGGCAKFCNTTRTRPECCKGFYGPDCKPCIGGFENPCYGKGTCSDGIHGTGSCSCLPGFTGIACHICSDPNKHGENCNEDCQCVQGVCDNRPGSNGVCRKGSCKEGYSGDLCSLKLTQCANNLFLHCHPNAYCAHDHNRTISCVCAPGYEGDGYSCIFSNPCLKPDRGGCDPNAQCVHGGPGNTSCVCNKGWTGDGQACAEINNCLLSNRGGCHANAECTVTGPGENECTCKRGYMGDGFTCDPVNPCRSNNGGCHALATCSLQKNGTHVCVCAAGFYGNGTVCYGDMLAELLFRSDLDTFRSLIQKSPRFSLVENTTALAPSNKAFMNLSKAEKDFWFDPFRLPFFLKVHFLDGVFSSGDLERRINEKLPTLNKKTQWEIKNKSGEIVVENASMLFSDIKVSNGYIHVINSVLIPPLSDIPPDPLSLMDFLNRTSSFSLFHQAIMFHNLSYIIQENKYTILIPTNEAIMQYFHRTNATVLDKDTVQYHVINAKLFPNEIRNGLLQTTLLGSSYQIMFHVDNQNQIFANDVLLNGNFSETKSGIVTGVPHILEIHKNYCNKEVALKIRGRCGSCDEKPKCTYLNSKPLENNFPPNMKSNCKYRIRVGSKKMWFPGCVMDCLRIVTDHACCPGYFGHMCLKCPGKLDNWCSNHGTCQDGHLGSGACQCEEGYDGTACETCKPGRYGPDCKSECNCSHGRCQDGIDGDGRCLCHKGWKGPTCSVEIKADECGGVCGEFANCITAGVAGAAPTCSCIAGYQGDGISCKEINPCDKDNGGCSEKANCTKTEPGERICVCHRGYTGDGVVCLEIDPCAEKNGGCVEKADCIKTGPGQSMCICKTGYSGNGSLYCYAVNPCRMVNGGCNHNAWCEYTGPGERRCKCRNSFIGDGFTCKGTINYEIMHHPDSSWLNRIIRAAKINDLSSKGPFTVFIPKQDFNQNFTIEPWDKSTRTGDLLRYHIVSCAQLSISELKATRSVVALSGHTLTFSIQEGAVYINNVSQIITSDYTTSNGIIHFIDKILIPYDLQKKGFAPPRSLNVTTAAEAYGYRMFSKLLKDANLMTMIENPIHQPFTMLWPTDEVFNSFPEERKKWLYSEDHRDKLAAYLKAHIIRDNKLMAGNLPSDESLRTMYGSTISFGCDKNIIGDIIIDNGNGKITERHLEFDIGVAHGIDQLLEPPDLGARCDVFRDSKYSGRCGSCVFVPPCPLGMTSIGEPTMCSIVARHSWRFGYRYDLFNHYPPFGRRTLGCSRQCGKSVWSPQCCKNHYGSNCQVCPGGLEAPCSKHGTCDDGKDGRGNCTCNVGFVGTACELCAPNHYGPDCLVCNCTLHGKCEDSLDGDGSCFCEEGWTGDRCELKLSEKPVCTPECHANAVCHPGNICQCDLQYEGDGRNCTAPDLCSEYNGGCHVHANCTQSGVNVSCSCLAGYAGDGTFCSAINRCEVEENGGCSEFATCVFTGPNERQCQCLPGFMGNGVQCREKVVPPVDRCLEENGGCDPRADCKDLHFHENTAGVFHLRSPAGKYKFNYTDARLACQAEQATLATFNQLSDAQQVGMHLCVAGWMDEAKVGYPIIYPSMKCGANHVGIVLYKSPVPTNNTYDAFCYRMKDVSCKCGPGFVGNGDFCNGDVASIVATNANFSTFYSLLLNYSNSVEGENLLTLLTMNSMFIMIFVPHNSGFHASERLSRRDMEYHISANNSVFVYSDLKHNSVIPSLLGYNLSVEVSSAAESEPSKMVNQRTIVDWDIPATNGIIHVIEGPLKAPPPPVVPHAKPDSQSSHSSSKTGIITTVIVTGLVLALAAGLAYYIFKQRRDPFRFQYFRDNEDEDRRSEDECSPALVSIPNPLYSGQAAFVEPFDVSDRDDSC